MRTTRCRVLLLLLVPLMPAGAEEVPAAPFAVRPLAEPRRTATRYEAFALIADTFHIDGSKMLFEAISEPFGDVPAEHWAAYGVDAMRRAGLCRGLGDGSFRGEQPLTRGGLVHLLAPLLRWLLVQVPKPARPAEAPTAGPAIGPEYFLDITTDRHHFDLDLLQRNGILRGYGDGTVRPKRPVTRRELQLCLERIAQAWDPNPGPHFTVRVLPDPKWPVVRYELYALIADVFRVDGRTVLGRSSVAKQAFTDVPTWHWAATSIEATRKAGLCEGYGDGTFRGGLLVTRYAFAYLASGLLVGLMDALGKPPRPPEASGDPFPDIPTDMWYGPLAKVELLRQWGVIQGYPDRSFRGKRPLTRGELEICLERMAALWEPAGAR